MLDDIIAHDIAQGIGVPIPTSQNCLLPPWARIASRLRAHPTGLALLVPKQTFQEHTRTRRNTLLREQRTYPFLDFSKRRRPQRKRLFNRRCLRPRHSNHGCPWIQRSAKKATVMLVRDFADRGFFQNLIFSSPLLEVEMILALYLSFAAVVVGIVKAYRRRQDVLYGPYISQNDR